MAMLSPPDVWTRELVLALPDDGNRYELIDGELLVTASPAGPHQRAVMALYDRVRPFVRGHNLGYTCLAPADLTLGGAQVAQPDLFVVPLVNGREPVDWPDFGIPLLVAEVLSPATARADRIVKRRRYQAAGVATYWIVDTEARIVERWLPGHQRPDTLDQLVEWSPGPGLGTLAIDLRTYFREVWGEG